MIYLITSKKETSCATASITDWVKKTLAKAFTGATTTLIIIDNMMYVFPYFQYGFISNIIFLSEFVICFITEFLSLEI